MNVGCTLSAVSDLNVGTSGSETFTVAERQHRHLWSLARMRRQQFTVAALSGNTAIAGTLSAVSDFKVGADNAETFTVAASSGNTAVSGTLSAGATTVTGTLGVSSDMTVNTNKFVVTASDGSLNINSGKLTVAGASGNTAIAGTLSGVDLKVGMTGSRLLSSTHVA